MTDPTPTTALAASAFCDFSAQLHALYASQSILPKLIDDSSIESQSLDDYYVELQCEAKGSNGSAQPIAIQNIFDKDSGAAADADAPSKLLVIGKAGVGQCYYHYYYYSSRIITCLQCI